MDVLPYDWKTSDATNAHTFITEPILSADPLGSGLPFCYFPSLVFPGQYI